MKVINLWAGPGAGKSTASAGLFHKMKAAGKRVELVTEFTKDLVYEGNPAISNNLMILAEQDQRLRRLIGKVDFAITDSPLPLTMLYSKPPFSSRWFDDAALATFETYDNVNVFIDRVKPYYEFGRYQTEDEARALDTRVHGLLHAHLYKHLHVAGDSKAPAIIMNHLFPKDH